MTAVTQSSSGLLPTEVSLGHRYPQDHQTPRDQHLMGAPNLAQADQRSESSHLVSLLQPLQSACGAAAHPQLPKPKTWSLVHSPRIKV